MADLILYTNPMSRGRIARWMLEELGEPYEVRNLGYDAEGGSSMKSAAYLAINPMGKVPALTHGDVVVTEGAAICAYLADAFPRAGLAPPPGSPDRASYYRWLFFAAGPVEAAVTNKALGFQLSPGQERMAGYGSLEQVVAALEGAVAGRPFVAGERFSAADIYVGAQVGWGRKFGTLPPSPVLDAYWDGLAQRPAYLRATELDDAAMPKQDG